MTAKTMIWRSVFLMASPQSTDGPPASLKTVPQGGGRTPGGGRGGARVAGSLSASAAAAALRARAGERLGRRGPRARSPGGGSTRRPRRRDAGERDDAEREPAPAPRREGHIDAVHLGHRPAGEQDDAPDDVDGRGMKVTARAPREGAQHEERERDAAETRKRLARRRSSSASRVDVDAGASLSYFMKSKRPAIAAPALDACGAGRWGKNRRTRRLGTGAVSA